MPSPIPFIERRPLRRVEFLRHSLGMTQTQFGNVCGFPTFNNGQSQYGRYENGMYRLQPDDSAKILQGIDRIFKEKNRFATI